MAANRPATIDDYVKRLGGWKREVVEAVRELVAEAAPAAEETMKWNQPTWEIEEPICYVKPYSKHANVGFYRGTELSDPEGLLEGAGKGMRHVKVTSAEEVAEHREALAAMVREAAKLGSGKRRRRAR